MDKMSFLSPFAFVWRELSKLCKEMHGNEQLKKEREVKREKEREKERKKERERERKKKERKIVDVSCKMASTNERC